MQDWHGTVDPLECGTAVLMNEGRERNHPVLLA